MASLAAEAQRSEHLRLAMRHLGLWLIECADRADAAAPPDAGDASARGPGPVSAPGPAGPVETVAAAAPAPRVIEARSIQGPVEVRIEPAVAAEMLQRGLGASAGVIASRPGAMSDPPAAGDGREVTLPIPRFDVRLVESRCRLKTEGCDFALKRDRLMDGGGTFAPLKAEYEALVARGKALPDCFLWMIHPRALACEAPALEAIRACYANLADAAAMLGAFIEARGEGHWPEEALWALAEAQSALYASLLKSPLQKDDPDQLLCFSFVRDEARRRHLFMDRFLSNDAVADPAGAPDLAVRIGSLRQVADAERTQAKARRQAMNKAEYHASKLDSSAPDELEANLGKIEQAALAYLEHGGSPRSEALLRVARAAVRTGGQVLAETSPLRTLVDQADRPAEPAEPEADQAPESRAESPEVARARELLRGKVVLLIGGQERPLHARSLEQAFELEELRWAPHREHASLAPMEHEIAKADVGLVLLPIRWNGTETGPKIRKWCERYQKPCVTLTAGYNANQIAHAVLQQVSERLATS